MMTRLKMLWVVLTARSFVVALRADLGNNPIIKAERVIFHRVRMVALKTSKNTKEAGNGGGNKG